LELAAAQTWGIPVDYVAIAPYTATPYVNAVSNAMDAAGGNMSLAAINDYQRLYHFCDAQDQGTYADHQAVIAAVGQPSNQITWSARVGGGFQPAGYVFCCTFVDGAGNE